MSTDLAVHPKAHRAKGWTAEVWVRYRYEAKVQRNRGAAETSPTISTGDGSAEEGDGKGRANAQTSPPEGGEDLKATRDRHSCRMRHSSRMERPRGSLSQKSAQMAK